MTHPASPLQPPHSFLRRILSPVSRWIDDLSVKNPAQARYIARTIPAQCPFERELSLFGRTVMHIPPLCKLNPLYDEVVALRFRALCYLADECGEDITAFI